MIARRILSFVLVTLAGGGALLGEEPPILFEEPLSPRIANYEIDVRLDPALRMIHGEQILTWVNKSPVEIRELRFHLYLNAFRNTETTFLRESGGRMRGAALDHDGWGFIEVDRIGLPAAGAEDAARLRRYVSPHPGMVPLEETPAPTGIPSLPINRQAVDLTSAMEFIQPDDGNPHDLTVFRLPLPAGLPPGAAVVLEIDFHAQLPTPPFARTGAEEDYFLVGQWFPKIGVHTGAEWSCHQFHYNSEFFADFGVYDVDMTVPAEYVVGATGQEFERVDLGDGQVTHRYHAEDVHDFAWTASPDFVELETTADDVAVRLLLQKDNLDAADIHLEATTKAIQHFQATWGDYPFPNFTVVDPRRGAGGSGGMEYPTFVTAGSEGPKLFGIRDFEVVAVVVHEFGHNYWYHLLASNEAEESWLDEGINTYTDIRVAEEVFGDRKFLGMDLDYQAIHRTFLRRILLDPVDTVSWSMYDRRSYGTNSYYRPGIVLETLRNLLGPERMNQVMRAYVERWRFRHPSTQDFVDVVLDVAGDEHASFLQQALHSTRSLDYSVARISNREIDPRGYDLERSVEEPWDGEGRFPDGAEGEILDEGWESSVWVQRRGEFVLPVRLQVEFDDGTVVERTWDGEDRWRRFDWQRDAKVVSATVDPEGHLLLDRNLLNNGRTLRSTGGSSGRMVGSLRWALQVALDLVSF